MPSRPTKLKTDASAMAVPGRRHRVETAVAMALGASVAPEMTVTAITSATMSHRTGYIAACSMKAERVSAIGPQLCKESANNTSKVRKLI